MALLQQGKELIAQLGRIGSSVVGGFQEEVEKFEERRKQRLKQIAESEADAGLGPERGRRSPVLNRAMREEFRDFEREEGPLIDHLEKREDLEELAEMEARQVIENAPKVNQGFSAGLLKDRGIKIKKFITKENPPNSEEAINRRQGIEKASSRFVDEVEQRGVDVHHFGAGETQTHPTGMWAVDPRGKIMDKAEIEALLMGSEFGVEIPEENQEKILDFHRSRNTPILGDINKAAEFMREADFGNIFDGR